MQKLVRYSLVVFLLFSYSFLALSEELELNMELLAAKENAGKDKIVLIAPFTGDQAALGHMLLDSASISLFQNNQDNLVIVPIDENRKAESSKKLEEALKTGSKVVLGPVFSGDVKQTLDLTNKYNAKLFTFSNDKSLKNSGAFVSGYLPETQAESLLEYATTQGVKDFYLILPSGKYGMTLYNTISSKLTSFHGKIKNAQFYDENKASIEMTARTMAQLTTKEQGFDPKRSGIFIVDAGGQLLPIYKIITEHQPIQNLRFFGITKLENDELLELNNTYISGYSGSEKKKFIDTYVRVFGSKPNNLAFVCYDLMQNIAGRKGQIDEGQVMEGLDGKFSFEQNGLIQRAPNITLINEGQIQLVQ